MAIPSMRVSSPTRQPSAYDAYMEAQKAAQEAAGKFTPGSTRVYSPTNPWGSSGSPGPSAGDLAREAQQRAEQLVMEGTFGRGSATDTDPRVAAALDALNPETVQNNMYGQLTDATAAQAGSQADMLREQMAQSGMSLSDPAAQARLRSIETNRMQANNAGLGQAQLAGQDSASRMAQIRLQQMQQANQAYSQGASMLAQKQFGQRQVSAGYSPSVPRYEAPARQPAATQPAWETPEWVPGPPATGATQAATAPATAPAAPAAAAPAKQPQGALPAGALSLPRRSAVKPYR